MTIVEPITVEERMEWFRDWHKDLGLESLIKRCAGMEQHLSDKCKEYRKIIKAHEDAQNLTAGTTVQMLSECDNRSTIGS